MARGDSQAKFWLDPIRLDDSAGFARAKWGRIEELVTEHATLLRKAWDDFFAS